MERFFFQASKSFGVCLVPRRRSCLHTAAVEDWTLLSIVLGLPLHQLSSSWIF